MSPRGASHGPDADPLVESTGFRFGWAAALAGILIAAALMIVFALLGMAIGFSWWSPDSAGSLGMAAGIWMILSWILALFIGAMVTGRLAGILTRGDGALHGLVIWAGATVVAAFMLVGGVGFLAGTAFDLLGRAVGATASAAVTGVTQLASTGISEAGGLDYGSLQSRIQELLEETGDPALHPDTLESAGQEIGEVATGPGDTDRAARRITERIERTAGEVDREDIVNVVAAETGLSRAEAENVADRVTELARQARGTIQTGLDTLGSRATETAETVSAGLGSAAWWTLLTLLLAAGAAMAGGTVKARS